MKKYISIAALLLSGISGKAQVLAVPQITQEQTEWCWAGCSKCILNYYTKTIEQCQIAEYARERITWTSFGRTNCCIDGVDSCNTPNYEADENGSIQDILQHFDAIRSTESAGPLTQAQIAAQMSKNELFVEHWSWSGGGGHFVVGHGISHDLATIYYMNPLPGEGLTMCTYATMLTDGDYTWDYTLELTSDPLATEQVTLPETKELLYPNPSTGIVYLSSIGGKATTATIINAAGNQVAQTTLNNQAPSAIDLNNLPKGIYFVKLNNGTESKYVKLALQ